MRNIVPLDWQKRLLIGIEQGAWEHSSDLHEAPEMAIETMLLYHCFA